jgi:hypothetical protein
MDAFVPQCPYMGRLRFLPRCAENPEAEGGKPELASAGSLIRMSTLLMHQTLSQPDGCRIDRCAVLDATEV